MALNGGKHYLAPKIVALMPRHLHYVEPYAGGLSVLLERDPNDKRLWLSEKAGQNGVSEVANDINGELTNFWRVLATRAAFEDFLRIVQAIPFSRQLFDEFGAELEKPAGVVGGVERAAAFFVRARQSRAGTFKGFTSLTRNRTRRGVNGNVSEWLGAVDGLPAVHARLQPVVIENMPALDLIRREDTPHTLFYLDPPYLHETRATTDAYAHEMSEAQHFELLTLLGALKGKLMLSGYHSTMYDSDARRRGWSCHEFNLANHAAGGDSKRRMTECLWTNF